MKRITMKDCLVDVMFSVEVLGDNPFELLGRFVIRADLDPGFNRAMIDACKQYIIINNIK